MQVHCIALLALVPTTLESIFPVSTSLSNVVEVATLAGKVGNELNATPKLTVHTRRRGKGRKKGRRSTSSSSGERVMSGQIKDSGESLGLQSSDSKSSTSEEKNKVPDGRGCKYLSETIHKYPCNKYFKAMPNDGRGRPRRRWQDELDAYRDDSPEINQNDNEWKSRDEAFTQQRKWHRTCTPCPVDMAKKWRDPTIKWICGGYQRARRTFKSECMMYYRNCQDGTMFIKLHDYRCDDTAPGYNGGRHFFYDYKVALPDDTSGKSSETDNSQSSNSFASKSSE